MSVVEAPSPVPSADKNVNSLFILSPAIPHAPSSTGASLDPIFQVPLLADITWLSAPGSSPEDRVLSMDERREKCALRGGHRPETGADPGRG